MLLSEYDILYVTQKAIKGSALADYFAHQPIEDYQPMQAGFPDEDICAIFAIMFKILGPYSSMEHLIR